MRRRAFDTLMAVAGLVLAGVLFVAGGLLTWGYMFVNDQVHTQLVAQKIFFPPKGSEALSPAEFPTLQQYAGQQLVNGEQARAYANDFIGAHLKAAGGGQTYAQLSGKALANPQDTKLQATVQTMFRGETLRGLLLNAYCLLEDRPDRLLRGMGGIHRGRSAAAAVRPRLLARAADAAGTGVHQVHPGGREDPQLTPDAGAARCHPAADRLRHPRMSEPVGCAPPFRSAYRVNRAQRARKCVPSHTHHDSTATRPGVVRMAAASDLVAVAAGARSRARTSSQIPMASSARKPAALASVPVTGVPVPPGGRATRCPRGTTPPWPPPGSAGGRGSGPSGR